MSVTFSVSTEPVGEPVIATTADVRAIAARLSNPYAARAIAVTEPVLTTDQTRVRWEPRRVRGGAEYRVESGTITLTLRQRIVISDELTECQRGIWLQHERDHVSDNTSVMDDLETHLRADTALMAILDGERWFPRSEHAATQTRIRNMIAAVFQRRNGALVTARDTPEEYARVEARIAAECR